MLKRKIVPRFFLCAPQFLATQITIERQVIFGWRHLETAARTKDFAARFLGLLLTYFRFSLFFRKFDQFSVSSGPRHQEKKVRIGRSKKKEYQKNKHNIHRFMSSRSLIRWETRFSCKFVGISNKARWNSPFYFGTNVVHLSTYSSSPFRHVWLCIYIQ